MVSALTPVIVACAVDDFFAMPLAVTAFSALKNLNPAYRMVLYILDGGISQANKAKLTQTLDSERAEIHWVKPSSELLKEVLLKAKGSSHPTSVYNRLLIPSVIPDPISRVIYLDADVVVEGDLAELWEQDFEGTYLLAARDQVDGNLLTSWHLNNVVKSIDLQQYEITAEHKYLNAGVLVLNLDLWRRDQIAGQVLDTLIKHPDFPFPDQDAINIVLAGKWKELNPRWNQTHIVHSYASAQESPYDEPLYSDLVNHPYIIHYTSRPKPWGKNCTHPQADRFFKYLDQTAWKGWRNNAFYFYTALVRRSIRRLKTALSRQVAALSGGFS